MEAAPIPLPTTLSPLMVDARLGTGPTPNALSAHPTGLPTPTDSVFPLATFAEPMMQLENALHAIRDMTSILQEHASSLLPTQALLLMLVVKFGTGQPTPAANALSSGFQLMVFAHQFLAFANHTIPFQENA